MKAVMEGHTRYVGSHHGVRIDASNRAFVYIDFSSAPKEELAYSEIYQWGKVDFQSTIDNFIIHSRLAYDSFFFAFLRCLGSSGVLVVIGKKI
ncbi:unnamed protein product [Phytomonas sp. Hart1]|nr:unnamed protein product [Phytomonas sp. Hart1]|eukprot:CCW70572.1 unnamed protein product [Phytomonas sp. isolate Hart1]